ncbi:MAG: hypothetical protein A2Y93_08695 [Chloroflexi bacterium RBG_13_68_17]|nr:MAG: hypothetical protein A2Y93_08695 [Chloroflexi bacterium RBG_13_68_17]
MQTMTVPTPRQDPRSHARAMLRWLILAPPLLLITSLCASVATARAARPPGVETTSRLMADYRPWDEWVFAPVQPDILAAIARDLGLSGVPGVVSLGGCFLPGGDCGMRNDPPSATPTVGPPTPDATVVALAPTATATPTATVRIVPRTSTSTSAPPPADTPTSTPIPPTPTDTPTYTPTNTPCAPPCEPDMGPPDGGYATPLPGTELTFILSTPIVVDGNSDWDLVYYERRNGALPEILLDLVVIKIGINATGEWFVVFDWGDGIVDANSSVSGVAEGPNAWISMSTPASILYGTPPLNTGILIDVDHAAIPPPTGVYDRLSITGPTPGPGTPPYGAGDVAEVDAVEVLPTPTP